MRYGENMDERKLLSTIIRYGSYFGIGILAAGFAAEILHGIVDKHIPSHVFIYSGIIVMILTPVTGMLGLSIFFFRTREWKWSLAALTIVLLIVLAFFIIRHLR